MKVRAGFVSNSSSSSFCIYGTSMDFSEVIEKIKESNLIPEDELEQLLEDDEWYEIGEVLSEKMDLEVLPDYEQEYLWIGRSWSNLNDDETGRQFKESVKTKLEVVFGPDIDCDTHEGEICN